MALAPCRERGVRLVLASVVALLPFNALRVLAYRCLLGYRVRGARIGWGTLVHVAGAELDACRISRHNRFVGPFTLRIGKGTTIDRGNGFVCGWWTLDFPEADYRKRLEIGERVRVTCGHHFDCCGAVTIGDDTWIAGVGSQFWTHGSHGPGAQDGHVRIGARCYVGSASLFGPGAEIRDNTLVAMGSLVVRRYPRANQMIGGVPAEVLRSNYDWQSRRETEPNDEAGPVQGV